jgi:hypothetical protein
MSSPSVDHNNSSKTSIVNDAVIKGVVTHKPKGYNSRNSLDREEDQGRISFKNSLDIAVINIAEIIK